MVNNSFIAFLDNRFDLRRKSERNNLNFKLDQPHLINGNEDYSLFLLTMVPKTICMPSRIYFVNQPSLERPTLSGALIVELSTSNFFSKSLLNLKGKSRFLNLIGSNNSHRPYFHRHCSSTLFIDIVYKHCF